MKAGSWVLKHEGKGYRKCPLCGESDSEIHRIIKCTKVQTQRKELGIDKLIEEMNTRSRSDVEVLGNLTMGDVNECLSRGKLLLELEKLFE